MERYLADYQRRFAKLPPSIQNTLLRGQQITKRMVANADQALDRWALWEELNEKLVEGSAFAEHVRFADARGLVRIRFLLVEGTVLSTLKVTDHASSNNSLTACLLRGILANDEVVSVLISDEWLASGILPTSSQLLVVERERQPQRLRWFNQRVPMGWSKSDQAPEVFDLKLSRQKLRELRNTSIAHPLESLIDAPTYDDIRDAVDLSRQVARAASLLFLGHASGLDGEMNKRREVVEDFWNVFERGLSHSNELQQAPALDQ
ncbi:MAG: hypothetical protein SH859_03415 [Hyphomicrobium aestuarii]|nr:hypothetical protein [Hyphomicrobium aestuarii]